MKKELTTAQMLGICLGDFARAILSGLIVTYTLKFFNVTPSSGLPLLIPAGMMGTLRGIGPWKYRLIRFLHLVQIVLLQN